MEGRLSTAKVNGGWGQGGREVSKVDVFAAVMLVFEFNKEVDGSCRGERADDVLIRAIAVERSLMCMMLCLLDGLGTIWGESECLRPGR